MVEGHRTGTGIQQCNGMLWRTLSYGNNQRAPVMAEPRYIMANMLQNFWPIDAVIGNAAGINVNAGFNEVLCGIHIVRYH